MCRDGCCVEKCAFESKKYSMVISQQMEEVAKGPILVYNSVELSPHVTNTLWSEVNWNE